MLSYTANVFVSNRILFKSKYTYLNNLKLYIVCFSHIHGYNTFISDIICRIYYVAIDYKLLEVHYANRI
jgi:hypothetical protein